MAQTSRIGRRIPPRPGSKTKTGGRAAVQVGASNLALPPSSDLPLLRTSERGQFKRCPQRWWWGSVEGLQPAGPPNIKLWFGTGWHHVMAAHYRRGKKRGKNIHKVWDDWVGDELARIRVKKNNMDFSHDTYIDARDLGHSMIDGYLERYGQEDHIYVIEPEHVGQIIIPRIGDDKTGLVLYSFTYDLVYADERDDTIWLMEHKSAAQISTNHLELDDQGGSYWAVASHELRQEGKIGAKQQIKGIMYNFARKAPRDTRLRDADGLARNKPVKKDFAAAFTEAGITLDKDAARMDIRGLQEVADDHGLVVMGEVSKSQPSGNFVRYPVLRTRYERREQIRKIQNEATVMAAFRSGQLPLYKNPTKDCHWDCAFRDMCLLHERGSDWEEFRDAVMVRGDPYEPYRKDSTLEAQDG